MGQPVLAQKPLTKEESAKVIEAAIRRAAKKPTGELTKADLEKVTKLVLEDQRLLEVPKEVEKLTSLKELSLMKNRFYDVTSLEKFTQLEKLNLTGNQLTDVKGLEKLTDLRELFLRDNPSLTEAQIDQLQKALPECLIYSDPTK